MNPSPRCAKLSSTVLRYGTVLALSAALVAAQSRIVRPPAQSNSAGLAKRPHVATLRVIDSPEGSRVALSSDQSLNNYEAYRRGDRFYVRIPAADVPRAEATRGRGFADVKAQRSGDSTVISFRLQPGTTAHVEQLLNRLEVVFTVPGGNTSANAGRHKTRPRSNPDSVIGRGSNANKQSSSNSSSVLKNATKAANRNANLSATRGPISSTTNSASKAGSTIASSTSAGSKPVATSLATATAIPEPTASAKSIATPAQKASSVATPANQTTPAVQVQTRGSFLAEMKERLNYWILLAQLNPIPVAIGAGVFLLIIALLVFQRRRAKATRRIRPSQTESRKTKLEADAVAGGQATASKSESSVPASTPAAAAELAAVPVNSTEAAKPQLPPPSASADSTRRARVARVAQVAEELKKVMAGGDYDENVIGSDDREIRQLVGAELLAALVGRSLPRRERARAAFMKHGYFDDATHDLRIAESSNERAAAARRLSFVHDSEATPHLIGALDDLAPDVRRAAVEALMDLRDPAAIGPLNSLLQTENDRKVPRTLIKHAIDACAISTPAEHASLPASSAAPPKIPGPASLPADSEREVIEI